MERIFVIDDDNMSLTLLRSIFQRTAFEVTFFSRGADALKEYQPGKVELIICDYFMPGLDGSDLLRQIRRVDKDVGFVYLTSNQDLRMAVEMVKAGADDHIVKPIQPEEFLARVAKNIEDARRRQLLRHFEEEVQEEKLENHSMINWRLMYATKETKQIEQAISLMNRTMNQAGGFIWADILRSMVPPGESETVSLPRQIIELSLEAAARYKELFGLLEIIGNLDSMDLDLKEIDAASLVNELQGWLKTRLFPLYQKYGREVRLVAQNEIIPARYRVDLKRLEEILFELSVNALKYSPPGTDIVVGWQQTELQSDIPLIFSIANHPAETQALHEETWRIRGIPREYSEQVFELFYTIDAFPIHLEEETWKNGTGLHIVRKLMHRMGGWVQNHNIVDYTGNEPVPYVEFNLRFPMIKP